MNILLLIYRGIRKKVRDALGYLAKVKKEFLETPLVYKQFLSIMKDFKKQEYGVWRCSCVMLFVVCVCCLLLLLLVGCYVYVYMWCVYIYSLADTTIDSVCVCG